MIAENLKDVTQRIARCCEKVNRSPLDVQLVCVTKGSSIDEIEEVLDLGVQIVGENRVQEASSKYRSIGNRAVWHLVGHLQTNKVKDAVSIFSLIHSVDRVAIAKEIDKEANRLKKVQDILIQVNTSGEETKFGIAPDQAINILKEIFIYPNINVRGLMTIAPEVNDPEEVRPYFRRLKKLRDEVNKLQITDSSLQILSMGMSNDFEVAIEEGSNMVRIGRAIFGR